MAETPKISVIVPVYNMEKTLRRALDSLVTQTYRNFEVLLIDDGSQDSSGTICDEYADRYFYIKSYHKPNGGLSSVRNFGMEQASGEWITFCDSDDFVFPHWLENYDLENAYDVDLVQQGAKSDKPNFGLDLKQDWCGFDYCGEPLEYLDKLMLHQMVGYTWMKAYRLNIIQKYNITFDTCIKLKEDEIFLFQYLTHCKKIRSINKQGYYYFVPNWKGKYKLVIDESLYFHKIYLKSVMGIFKDRLEKIRFYKDSYCYNLMIAFSCKSKLEYLKEIRQLHEDDYDCSRLFAPLKWLIVKDKTYMISWLALFVHTNLRSMIKKW